MEWIKVEDRLPKGLRTVLVWADTSLEATPAVFIRDKKCLYHSHASGTFYTDEEGITVTHWMPLPEPPTD